MEKNFFLKNECTQNFTDWLSQIIIGLIPLNFKSENKLFSSFDEIKNNIHWFFSNYKSKTPGKWSKVDGFRDKEYAITTYKRSCLLYGEASIKNEDF